MNRKHASLEKENFDLLAIYLCVRLGLNIRLRVSSAESQCATMILAKEYMLDLKQNH